jgi:ubiquinone/menaquinone biosynthesis C-methylase UbiE
VSEPEVRHPVFARVFDRLSRVMERDVGEHRTQMLTGLTGRVLEVGAGNGINFGHYPATVGEVVAVEPESYLRGKAERAAIAARVRVTVIAGNADALPFAPASFDAAVASLVLCSVSCPAVALAEIRRVLKPGGELRFMEHVVSDNPAKARVQRAGDDSGLWPRIAGGCHCSRNTVAEINAAGFVIERCGPYDVGPAWMPTNPHVAGRAVVRAAPGPA